MSRTETAYHGAILPHSRALALPVAIFMVALVLPLIFSVAGLRLSPYRIFLLVMIPLLMLRWVSGQAGRVRAADIMVLLLSLWVIISLSAIHGPARGIEAGGIQFVETMGAYLMGRVFIRSREAFHALVRLFFLIILAMLPFAIIEAATGRNLILEAAGKIADTHPIRRGDGMRLGLHRVQGPFDHSILFGVFCGSAIAMTYLALGHARSISRKSVSTFLVIVTGATSLSSGAFIGMVAQIALLGWNIVLRRLAHRWWLLAALVAAVWIFLELAADRSPSQILINIAAFNSQSAWMRLHIWNYGTASILENPLLGIGFNTWQRPSWMSSSVDMFWIVHGMRHGVPAMVLISASFLCVYVPLCFKKGLDEWQSQCRLGLLMSLTGMFLMGWTVHFWNATFVLFMFLLGSGVWLLDAEPRASLTLNRVRSSPPEPLSCFASAYLRSSELEGGLWQNGLGSLRASNSPCNLTRETQRHAADLHYSRFAILAGSEPGGLDDVSEVRLSRAPLAYARINEKGIRATLESECDTIRSPNDGD